MYLLVVLIVCIQLISGSFIESLNQTQSEQIANSHDCEASLQLYRRESEFIGIKCLVRLETFPSVFDVVFLVNERRFAQKHVVLSESLAIDLESVPYLEDPEADVILLPRPVRLVSVVLPDLYDKPLGPYRCEVRWADEESDHLNGGNQIVRRCSSQPYDTSRLVGLDAPVPMELRLLTEHSDNTAAMTCNLAHSPPSTTNLFRVAFFVDSTPIAEYIVQRTNEQLDESASVEWRQFSNSRTMTNGQPNIRSVNLFPTHRARHPNNLTAVIQRSNARVEFTFAVQCAIILEYPQVGEVIYFSPVEEIVLSTSDNSLSDHLTPID